MEIRPLLRVLMAAAVAVAMTSVSGASTASAVPLAAAGAPPSHPVAYVPLRDAHAATPFDKSFKNLDYNGGAVMPSNTNYIVFWSPRGVSAYGPGAPPQYVTGVEQYFKDVADDSGGRQNVESVATQYNDLTGATVHYASTFGGAILDTHPYPRSECPTNGPVIECLTDAQIQRELERVVAARHLKRDLRHE